jgi:hypothetical protein
MKRITMGAAVGAAVAGVVAGQVLAARQRARWPVTITGTVRDRRPRWHVITINRPMEQVAPGGQLPEPIAKLGDEVEVQVHPAVGNRGTALAARLRREPTGMTGLAARVTGDDPRQQVRTALRQSKQLVETGEILMPEPVGTTKRTFTGLPVELAARRAGGEGRL